MAGGDGGEGEGPQLRVLPAWEALLGSLLEEEIGALNKTKLKELHSSMIELTMEEKLLHIRTCRFKKAYDPDKLKLVVAVRGAVEPYRVHLVVALGQVGAEVKQGRAPPGGMERAIQNLITRWKE